MLLQLLLPDSQTLILESSEIHFGALTLHLRLAQTEAVQVADRFHLLQNLREAIQRLLDRHQAVLRKIKANSDSTETKLSASRPRRQSKTALRKEQRLLRCAEIKQLHAQGLSQRAIAGRLKLDRRTVRRYILADVLPEPLSRAIEPNILTPFYGYLTQRWNEGCRNAVQLWREIREHGYKGPRARVYRWSVRQCAHSADTSSEATKTKNDQVPACLRGVPRGWSCAQGST